MEGKNIRVSHRRVTRLIQLGVGLLLGLALLWNPKPVSVQSSPVPQVTLSVPAEVLIGEDFTFTVKFKNAGNQIGYGPFIDLVLDAGGANIGKNNPACACDGITFVKAEMVGVVGGPVSLNSFPVTALCNPTPPTVPHPFASSGVGPVAVPAGAQLITLELPFGSFDPTQPEIEVQVTAHVSNLADAGTPLKISARGGFRYGTDPLDNPGTDPPILSDTTPSTQWTAQAQTTPTVLIVNKKYLGPEDENATGPNFTSFYPLRYQITVDIANGQTVSNVTVTDCFPNNLAFQSVFSVSPSTPAPTVTPPPAGVPNNPPNNCLTVTWPSLTGAAGPDGTIVVEFFIPEKDASGNPVLPPNCQPVQSVNDVKAEGDWTPIDLCDTSPAHVVSDITASDHILNDKCIAIQKKVSVFQDTGAPGPTPGDVLQYTLTFQISDFKTFGKLEVRDLLSDGQQFLSTPAPTLTVTDQFGTVSGPFIPLLDVSVTGDPNSICQGIKGTTNLVFRVSQKMTSLFPSNPRHLAGILTGGWATTPTSSTPATGQIVFYARIQDQFSFPQNHPGDPFVDKDDPLANCVEIRGEVFTNVNPPQVPAPTGVTARDDSQTLTAIVADLIKKTVYAVKRAGQEICGPTTSACPAKPQVTPGDEVTFRIEKVIPSGDAENLTIQDWLPLPIFDVADPDANGSAGPAWSFTSAACGIPTPGQACLGPTNTLTVSPSFAATPTTNSLTFNYGTFNNPANTPRKIDLLFTLTATNDPFADGLFLTNEAQECETNTFNMKFCQVAIAQVEVREPELRIVKGIVAANTPAAVFSPVTPPPGIFTLPGGSCPRFSGMISSPLPPYLNSNVSNVDANDCLTFVITVENTGGSKAYDVKLRDIFPLGPTDIPSCFVPNFDSLCVTDGTGATVPFTKSPGGFGSVIITLQNPLPGLDPNSPGKNLVVITFDACLVGDIKPGCCDNRARLENYASTPGGPNFVEAGFGGPFEDPAQMCVQPKATKSIMTTSEAHTPGTPSGSPQSPEQLAIGEIIRYRLEVVVPETSAPLTYKVQDLLPAGLSFLPGSETVTTIHDGGLSVGNLPPVVSGGPFNCGNAGADPTFDFGTVTNTDNDPNPELIVLEFNALVCNITGNQDGTVLNNSFRVFLNGQQAASSNVVQAVIVEPKLTLTKAVTPNPVLQGGLVTYTLTLTNTGTATAFDVVLADMLPMGLTLVPGSLTLPAGCTGNIVGQNINVTCSSIPAGSTGTITYQAVATCDCPMSFMNQAKVSWTSLPGPTGTCPNPTGSCTPGNSGVNDGERNGSSAFPPNPPNSPDPPNKYHATASASLTVNCPPCVDPSSLPNMVAWWPLDEPNGSAVVNDLAGVNNQGTPTPGSPLGAANAPNAVAGQVGGAIRFNPNLQPNGPHLVVQDHAELNPGTGDLSIDAWVFAAPAPPTAGFIYPIVDKLVVQLAAPNIGFPVKGYAFYLDNGAPSGARLRFTMADGSGVANYTGPPMPFNTWTHVAVTVNRASGAVTFYVNGTPTVVTTPSMPTGSLDTPGTTLLIGESRLGLQAEIIIDELEIFKSVLTQTDIQSIKNQGKCKCAGVTNEQVSCNPNGTFSYTATVTNLSNTLATGINIVPPSGVTVTPSSITTPLSPGQSLTGTVTISGPSAQPGATICFDIVLTLQGQVICQTKHCITLPTCPGPGPCVQAPSGLVGWWPLDDAVGQNTVQDAAGGNNGTTKDASGNPLNISPGGAVSQLPDPINIPGLNPVVVDPSTSPPRGALFFKSNSFAEVPHNSNLNIGPNGFTITLWAWAPAVPIPIEPLVEKFDLATTNGYSLYLEATGSGTYALKFNLNGTVVTGPSVPFATAPTDWRFIVARVSSSGSVTLTVCDLGGSCTTSPSTTVTSFTTSNTAPLWFARSAAANPAAVFTGLRLALDEIEIFNRALTQAELQTIYDAERQGTRKCPPAACVPPPSDMVVWYPLDEPAGATAVSDIAPPPGSTVSDTGTPKPGPVGSGGPDPVAGKVGAGALYFFGPFVEVPHSADLTFSGDFSIDAWIRVVECGFSGGGVLAPIVDKWDPNTQTGFSLFVDQPSPSTGFLKLQLNTALFTSATSLPTGANPLANTGPWVHVAVTVNRTTGVGTFYINGAPAGTFTVPSGSITNMLPMLIGEIRVPGGRCEIAIDELELFNRALTPTEIQDIFAADSAGKCKPPTGKAEICIFKFDDLNGDGKQAPNEPPLPGWSFTVNPAPLPPATSPVTTGPQGGICFGVAAPGTYTITEQVQSGWTPTTPNPQTVTVQPGQTVNLSFGNKRQQGQICVVKFEDLDGDGVQDPNEPLLPGWQFTVTDANNNPVGTLTTSPPGTPPACLTVAAPGTYTITETVQSGWMPTTPNPQTVTVQPGQTANLVFGNKRQQGQICVVKFNDLNSNGVQDSGEPLLPGWQFTVTDQNNNPVGALTTNPPGTPPACLTVAAPGTYIVTEQVQSGWTPTTPNPQTVTVQPGQTANLTFGNQGKAEICVFKFNDLNGNGKQDTNEPPLPGWSFTVSPAPLPPATSPVTTGPQGGICFGVVAPGTYTITEQVQSGWMPTTPTTQTVTVTPGQLVNLTFGNQQGVCDREIKKTITPNPVQSGQPVTITLTVTNVGTVACPAVAGVIVADPQPTGMTFNPPVTVSGGGAAGWSCSITGPSGSWPGGLQCTSTSPLLPGAANAVTITFTATVSASPGTQIQNCAQVTNVGDANQANNQSCAMLQVTGCVTPPANMTAWWPLDETSGTTANDLAGVANNGTHVNGPTPTSGIVAGALRFDGVNDHVRVPDHAELDVGTGDFTLDAWVRTTAAQGVVVLVDKRSGPTPLGYSLFLGNGRLGFQMANGVGSSTCAATPTPGVSCVNYGSPTSTLVADGQWHHVAAVVDRANATSGVRLYVDGVQVFSGAPLGGNLDNASDLYMGVRTPGQGGGGVFPGDLDEGELIKRALTLQEIQALFQARSAGKCKGCIEGMKWNDANGNGVLNPGEGGLSGWTIQLSGPVSATTTTGTGGTYRFCGLPPGTYTVSEVLQPGWVRTFPPSPGTHTVTLALNQTVSNRNFGNRRVIVLPDFVVKNLRVLPPTIPRGGIAVVSFDIVNQGEGEAGPATHQVRLFIRRPGGVDIDVLLATVTTGTLAAGASQSFTVPIRLPQEVPTGPAVIRVLADSGSTVNESNEENNTAEVQITITGGP